jgi:hypothetical protein
MRYSLYSLLLRAVPRLEEIQWRPEQAPALARRVFGVCSLNRERHEGTEFCPGKQSKQSQVQILSLPTTRR